MKRYINNLIRAICGQDPYRTELEALEERYNKAASHVEQLQSAFLSLNEKLGELERKDSDYQALVENYRERIREKDEEIAAMNKGCQECVEKMRHPSRRTKSTKPKK